MFKFTLSEYRWGIPASIEYRRGFAFDVRFLIIKLENDDFMLRKMGQKPLKCFRNNVKFLAGRYQYIISTL